MIKKFIIGFLFTIAILFTVAPAWAQTNIVDIDSPDKSSSNSKCITKYDCGNYTLDDIVMIAIRASKWILGIVGSLALLMFVYGGFMFLISAGSSDKVSKAKTIITAAVAGLIIVFSSYLIIQFVLKTVGISWDGSKQDVSRNRLTANII